VTPFASENGFQINAAGQRQEMNEYQVDGVTVNSNSRDGVVNIDPEPDTVAEMKVTASSFQADKGVQSGALIETFTKSGTNTFHGSLSEMHFDNALAAEGEFGESFQRLFATISAELLAAPFSRIRLSSSDLCSG